MGNPAETILEVTMSYAVPRCLHVLAEMGIADALGDSARTAADLAVSTGANADALARALRLVSAYGIFERRNDGYVHTPASRLLRTDHPSIHALFRSLDGRLPLLEERRIAGPLSAHRRADCGAGLAGRCVGVFGPASRNEPPL